jgi:hypothetical protein
MVVDHLAPILVEKIMSGDSLTLAARTISIDWVIWRSEFLKNDAFREFYEAYGWDRVRKAHQQRMRYGRDLVMAELGVGTDELREENLPMGVVPIHNMQGGVDGLVALGRKLSSEYKIEVPTTIFGDKYFFRISGHLYNTPADYEALAMAVRKELT